MCPTSNVVTSREQTSVRCRTFKFGFYTALALLSFLAVMLGARGQGIAFKLGFPLHDSNTGAEINPYSAPIISVVDHFASPFGKGDSHPNTVLAYTGEEATRPSSCLNAPCGGYNPYFCGLSNLRFYVNGSFAGGDALGSQCTDSTGNALNFQLSKNQSLDYRGHTGFDYVAGPLTLVYAAHDGDVFIPAHDPILDCLACTPVETPSSFNTFYIRDASGWTTWYLHTKPGSITASTTLCNITGISQGASLKNGDICVGHVKRGDLVAKSYDTGVPGNPHLHFEVRAACNFATTTLSGCKVVDPYGWEWFDGDPINPMDPISGNVQGMHIATPLWDLSTWNLTPPPQVTNATVTVSGSTWNITVNGSNFLNPTASLWHATKLYCIACGSNIQSLPGTSSQFMAQVQVSDSTITPDLTLIKVTNASNGAGPRSSGTPLELAASTANSTSLSLLLYKSPAPGGGVFLGFGGFHSATDDGQIAFNSGVDKNGDNTPDVLKILFMHCKVKLKSRFRGSLQSATHS